MPEEIFTSCAGCVFATRNKSSEQTACSIDKLQCFDPESIAKHDGSYTISGRRCMWKRSKTWLEKRGNPEFEEASELAHDELVGMQLRYRVIVFCEEQEFDSIQKTVESALSQNIMPKNLLILQLNKRHPINLVYDLFSQKNYKKWKVETRINSDQPKLSFLDTVLANDKHNYPWYITVNAGNELPNLSDVLDNLIVQEMRQVLYIKTEAYEAYNKLAHLALNGNYLKPLRDKVREQEPNLCIDLTKEK